MRRNSVNSASGLKNCPHAPSCSATTISYKRTKIVAIWQHKKRVLGDIFTAHAQTRLFRNFRSKIWSCHSLWRPRFPIRQMHFHYRVTFTGYIRCFCATASHDLVALTFDLLTLRVSHVKCFSCPIHIPIIIILWLSVTELWVLNIWSHFRYLKQSLRMRRVTWPLTGGKNSLHFWNPWPQFAYSLCHFQGATTKIKPCYRQKIAFSHYEGYSVYCACAVSRDLCSA